MPRLQDVNTTSLTAAINLGCHVMQNIFNADDGDMPFFDANTWPHGRLAFSPHLSECHVPGRHLNALLAAEAATGVALDPAAIERHRRAAFFSFSGPVCLPLNRQEMDGPLVNFSAHNLREGLHALYALVRYRRDAEAQALAERYMAEVHRYWNPADGWASERLRALGLTYEPVQGPLNGETRMLGPLVKYTRATGSPAALRLALMLGQDCLDQFFWPDGAYDHARFVTDHTHSITGSLSSLAQLGDLLGDAAILERVKAFYDDGLWQMRDEIGWSPGAVFQKSDRGEAGNVGDIVETALILGRHGWPEYYHDAERILRCHLLPAQLRDVSFIPAAPHPAGGEPDGASDGVRDVATRLRGAYGMPAPYGHWPAGEPRESIGYYMDVVGSVVGSLVEAYWESARRDERGHWVNLLFDRDTPAVTVKSPYTHDCLEISLKQPGPLFVRLPPWLDDGDIALEGAWNSTPQRWRGHYLFLENPPVGTPIRLRFPLKDSTLMLGGPNHPRPIRLRLKGDGPAAMDNFGMDLTFFDLDPNGSREAGP